MRRADRLFQIVQLLRARRLTTADALAAELQVSARTVYRDIADLSASGVPVLGEAGVGYALRQGYELAPLAFNAEEIEALAAGARLVKAWADPDLARAASAALAKIEQGLPEALRQQLRDPSLDSPRYPDADSLTENLKPLRQACRRKLKVRFEYTDLGGQVSQRTVRPLALLFWGRAWTLAAWCELRQDFRSFRVDRVRQPRTGPEGFKDEPGKSLKDLMAREKARREAWEHGQGHG
jgi:predicted DNA-binding transcriptional regulator YafY